MNAPVARLDASTVKAALTDPVQVCTALGLCEGAPRRDRGAWWREGDGIIVACPLHGGRSCHVFTGRDGTLGWTCYGCHERGDLFSLVGAVYGCGSFSEALTRAANLDAGAASTSTARPARERAPRPEPLSDEAFAALAQTLTESALTDLERHPDAAKCSDACGCALARDYLGGRALLGVALRDGWRVLPASEADQRPLVAHIIGAHGEEAWRRSGLARSGGPRFVWSRNALVIPWRDRAGRITALQRRLLDAPHEGERRYIQAGRVVDPYGADRLDAHPSWPVAFVEGATDALSLEKLLSDWRREGFRPRDGRVVVVGLPGAGAWRSAWASLARDRDAFVALDLDTKETAARAVKAARDTMMNELRAVARSVQAFGPSLDGRAVKDWGDAWVATRW
jgi:hypothetical protein